MEEFESKDGVLIKYNGNDGDVVIPEFVSKIKDNSFDDHIELKSISLSKNVKEFGTYVFCGCKNLERILVDHRNLYFQSIDGVLFNKAGDELICYPQNKSGEEYNIPSSVKTIGHASFRGCKNLKSIVFTNNVQEIGGYAFEYGSLEKVVICNNVKKIFAGAFHGCENLTLLTLSNSIKAVGLWTFWHCNLRIVNIPDGVESIGWRAFYDCDNLCSVVLPKTIKRISHLAFSQNLKEVYYRGTKKEWKNIDIDEPNDSLLNATIHFNYKL